MSACFSGYNHITYTEKGVWNLIFNIFSFCFIPSKYSKYMNISGSVLRLSHLFLCLCSPCFQHDTSHTISSPPLPHSEQSELLLTFYLMYYIISMIWDLKLLWWMHAVKSTWVISHAKLELVTNILETVSVAIMRGSCNKEHGLTFYLYPYSMLSPVPAEITEGTVSKLGSQWCPVPTWTAGRTVGRGVTVHFP
jgi:hypothetical protein